MSSRERNFYIEGYRMGGGVGPKAAELETQPQRYDPESGAALWNSGSVVVFVRYGELDTKTFDPIQPIINSEASYSLLKYDVIPQTAFVMRDDIATDGEIWQEIPSTDETNLIFDAKVDEYELKGEKRRELTGELYEQALKNLGLTRADEPDDFEGQNDFVDKIQEHIVIPDPHPFYVALPELKRILPPSLLPESLIINVTDFNTQDYQ